MAACQPNDSAPHRATAPHCCARARARRYRQAFAVQPMFRAFCESVAHATSGEFHNALTKGIFRTIEKSAARHDKDRRFITDNVLGLV